MYGFVCFLSCWFAYIISLALKLQARESLFPQHMLLHILIIIITSFLVCLISTKRKHVEKTMCDFYKRLHAIMPISFLSLPVFMLSWANCLLAQDFIFGRFYYRHVLFQKMLSITFKTVTILVKKLLKDNVDIEGSIEEKNISPFFHKKGCFQYSLDIWDHCHFKTVSSDKFPSFSKRSRVLLGCQRLN